MENQAIEVAAPQPGRANRPPPRPYMGRPDRQRNPAAENQWRGPPRRDAPPPRPTSARVAPASLPPPTQSHQAGNKHITTGNPADGSLFSEGVHIRETVVRQGFTPAAPALIEVSRQAYAEMLTDDSQLSKVLLPEYLDYYATCLLWTRIVHLKQANSQALTQQEQDLLTLTQTSSFCVPEPILLNLKQIGNVISGTKQHLYPEFPELPTGLIAGFGGYYGSLGAAPAPPPAPAPPVVDPNIHNLYEEIPCLGVLSEAVRHTISDEPPGIYPSALSFAGFTANQNLLGYRVLAGRRPEAKNLAFANGITPDVFPSYPANTGYNYGFMQAVSNVLAQSGTFKNTQVVFSTLAEVGALSQTIICRPIAQAGVPCLRGEVEPTSVTLEAPSVFGSGAFFCSQMLKNSVGLNDHTTWCCLTPIGAHEIPAPWVANRNARRNLPATYMAETFRSLSIHALPTRMNIIKTLVLTKR